MGAGTPHSPVSFPFLIWQKEEEVSEESSADLFTGLIPLDGRL
jgi:hypothetical protein